jgi:phage terminase large subunit-like protein
MSQPILQLPTSRQAYTPLLTSLARLPPKQAAPILRGLCQVDLFFLLIHGLRRIDADRDWLFERCREVQKDPNNRLDLWSREHYKSTIITFGLTIQDVLNDPDITVGIFSHTRPIAKGFLRQIKREFESNDFLKQLFPDVLWANPQTEAPKWSEDEGLIVKRKGNPKEGTVEAWGLVDGQPTSKHYKLMVYDDTVTRESVTTPDMIAKVTEAWELSRNLGSEGGHSRYIGTRYHFNDTYKTIMDRGVSPRIYPATIDGTIEGEPVLLTRERLETKRREMGPYTFACQMMQNPMADETQGFKPHWLRHYENVTRQGMNVCILVDAASEKKKTSDYTSMWVIGLNTDGNLYALDMVRDRFNLKQRADTLFALHRKWKPNEVGYEKYGMMADVEFMYSEMERRNYRFQIHELGGPMPKNDRIKRLMPYFEQGKVWLPQVMMRTDYQGRTHDLVQAFIEEEYKAFPVGLHDDMLDSLARMFDLYPNGLEFPQEYSDEPEYVPSYSAMDTGAWMGA